MIESQIDKSTILLICLGREKEKEELESMTARTLLRIFRPFGQLKKIVLFSRSPFVKAFLEFTHIEDAEMAREIVHDSQIDGFGVARIFPSKLEELKFSNKFIDYLKIPKAREAKVKNDASTHHSSKNDLASKTQQSLYNLPSVDNFPVTPAYVKTSQFDFETPQETAVKGVQMHSAKLDKKKGQASELNRKVSFNLTATEQKRDFSDDDLAISTTKTAPATQTHDEDSVPPSRVLLVSNVDANFKSSFELFNLFSCFGNLAKVLYMKNLRKVLLEYETVESAQSCLMYMHNRAIGKSKLKANFSKFHKINLKKNNKSALSQQFNDVTIGTKEANRFSSEAMNRITPPSSTLLFSCKGQDGVSPSDLYLLAAVVSKPLKMRVIKFDEELDEGSAKNSGSLRVQLDFSNIKEAAFVLAKCHGSMAKSERVTVSFSATMTS